jgi:hypothetical protein
MSARNEIETTLNTLAQQLSFPIAFENAAFVKPTNGKWMEVFILGESNSNRNVQAQGMRRKGVFTINVYSPIGQGLGDLENVVEQIIAAFPVFPKLMNTVSIEAPLSRGKMLPIDMSAMIPITGSYRVELN